MFKFKKKSLFSLLFHYPLRKMLFVFSTRQPVQTRRSNVTTDLSPTQDSENVVAKHLDRHLDSNNLHNNIQSAYHAHYRTETALLRVNHDIIAALVAGFRVALIMFDLSAAFDVINHSILMRCLELFSMAQHFKCGVPPRVCPETKIVFNLFQTYR